MRDVTPTRAAALALANEGRLMRQGYELLDETRMLLAGEMMRVLRDYEAIQRQVEATRHQAREALAAAVERHGLDVLQAYPVPAEPPTAPRFSRMLFLAVPLLRDAVIAAEAGTAPPAIDPSPEAEACRAAFAALLPGIAKAGALAADLGRLMREYRRIERRAKALENVLIPEIEETLKRVNEQLESVDREDTIRARRRTGREGATS